MQWIHKHYDANGIITYHGWEYSVCMTNDCLPVICLQWRLIANQLNPRISTKSDEFIMPTRYKMGMPIWCAGNYYTHFQHAFIRKLGCLQCSNAFNLLIQQVDRWFMSQGSCIPKRGVIMVFECSEHCDMKFIKFELFKNGNWTARWMCNCMFQHCIPFWEWHGLYAMKWIMINLVI